MKGYSDLRFPLSILWREAELLAGRCGGWKHSSHSTGSAVGLQGKQCAVLEQPAVPPGEEKLEAVMCFYLHASAAL